MTGKDGEKRTQTRRKLQFMVIALHLRGTRFSVDLNRGTLLVFIKLACKCVRPIV